MARYNTIRIGSTYLTDDGTSTGSPCRATVSGLGALWLDHAGVQFLALDGTPYTQVRQTNGRGSAVTVEVEQMPKTMFEAVIGTVQQAAAYSSTVVVDVAGDTGEFHLVCVPQFPEPVVIGGQFINGRVRGVTFNFTVVSRYQAYKLWATADSLSLNGRAVALTKS